MPVMDADDGEHPAGRAADCGDLGGRLIKDPGVELEAAIAPGLHRAKQSCLLEISEGVVRHAAQLLGSRRALADRRQEIAYAAEKFVRRHRRPGLSLMIRC